MPKITADIEITNIKDDVKELRKRIVELYEILNTLSLNPYFTLSNIIPLKIDLQ